MVDFGVENGSARSCMEIVTLDCLLFYYGVLRSSFGP